MLPLDALDAIDGWFLYLFFIWSCALLEGGVVIALVFWKWGRRPKLTFIVSVTVVLFLFVFTSYVVDEYMRAVPL